MEYFKDDLVLISDSEAEALLYANNCTRDAWADCDVWVSFQGAVKKRIAVQELKTKRWYKCP